MKNIVILFLLFFIISCGTSIQTMLSSIEETVDETYGYTIGNPIRIGYSSPQKSIDYTYEFIDRLRDSSNMPLKLLYRVSVIDTNYKPSFWEKIPKRYGNSGSSAILDRYTLTKNNDRDTVNLFVDIFKEEPLYIPKGLQFVK